MNLSKKSLDGIKRMQASIFGFDEQNKTKSELSLKE